MRSARRNTDGIFGFGVIRVDCLEVRSQLPEDSVIVCRVLQRDFEDADLGSAVSLDNGLSGPLTDFGSFGSGEKVDAVERSLRSYCQNGACPHFSGRRRGRKRIVEAGE